MARSQKGRSSRPQGQKVDVERIRNSVDLIELVGRYVELRKEGAEFKGRCPFHDDRTPSFTVNAKKGFVHCFGCEAHHDAIGFLMRVENINFTEACARLGANVKTQAGSKSPAREGGRPDALPVFPVPSDAPQPPAAHQKHGKPSTVSVYPDRDGRVLFYVYRFDQPDGRKDVLPVSLWRDASGLRWHWRALPEPRPLYGLDRLAERPAAPVLVTEGEKDADAAAALVPGFVVTTSPNGARSAAKADWEPLRGRRVVVWPDADAPGATYAADVARLALAAGARSVVVAKPEELAALRPVDRAGEPMPDGWGAADAAAAGIPADALGAALDALQAPPAPKAAERPAKPPKPRPAAATAARAGFVEITAGDHRGLRPGIYWQPVGVDRASGEPVEGEPQLICTPALHVEAKTRDANGGEWGRLLTWTDAEGRAHQWAMPARMVARGGDELREYLLAEGLEVTTDPARRRRLADYVMAAEPERLARCVARTGWHGGVYVLPDRSFGDSGGEPIILQAGVGTGPKLGTAGSLEEWRRAVAEPCAGNSRLVLALSLGFAAVCLGLSSFEGGGIHFKGRSSAGKSTAMIVAASIFGPPPPDGYVRQWRSSDNGIEAMAAMHSDLLLCLDELGQLEPQHATAAAYLLANGAAKTRLRPDSAPRATATWRLLFLSNGEVGLADLLAEAGGRQRAGTEVRVIDLPADAGAGLGLFDQVPDGMAPGAYADALRTAAKRNHGTALHAFLEALASDPDAVRAHLEEFVPRFANELAGPDAAGQVRRVAQRFALIAAGGVLASHAEVTGWQTEEAPNAARRCFADWLAARSAGRGESEPAAMLAQVKLFLEQHGEARFASIDRGEDERAPRTLQRCGWRKRSDAGTEYMVFTESFRNELCRGFDAREVAKVLIKCGALMPQGDSATRKERMPDGTMQRVYRVTPRLWEEL